MEFKKNKLQAKIIDLKHKLRDTDYQAIKYAENEITITEYSAMKENRRQWRAEINELEQQLKEFGG